MFLILAHLETFKCSATVKERGRAQSSRAVRRARNSTTIALLLRKLMIFFCLQIASLKRVEVD